MPRKENIRFGSRAMSISTAPDAVLLLNAWLALEALQPQTFTAQNKLLGDEQPRRERGRRIKVPPRLLVDFDLDDGSNELRG